MFTIGHSTRTSQEFVDLLKQHQISILIDVRRFPGSRRYPHFNSGEMQSKLNEHQIKYCHLEALGGRRDPFKDSKNVGWRNKSFRGYGDHMASSEFRRGIEQLLESCQDNSRVAIMCAEAVPWQCHRMLISDYLTRIFELKVYHILSDGKVERHSVTDFAQVVVDDGEKKKLLVYPAEERLSSSGGKTPQ